MTSPVTATVAALPPTAVSIESTTTAAATPENKRAQRFKLLKDFYKFLDATMIYQKILALKSELNSLHRDTQINPTLLSNTLPITVDKSTKKPLTIFENVIKSSVVKEREKLEKLLPQDAQFRERISALEKQLFEKIYQDRESYFEDAKKFKEINIIQLVEALFDFDSDEPHIKEYYSSWSENIFIYNDVPDYPKTPEQGKLLVLRGFYNKQMLGLFTTYEIHINCLIGIVYLIGRYERYPNATFSVLDSLMKYSNDYPKIELPNSNFFYGLLIEARRRQNQKETEIAPIKIFLSDLIPLIDIRAIIFSYSAFSFHDPLVKMTTIITEERDGTYERAIFHPDHFVNPPKGSDHLAFDHYIQFEDFMPKPSDQSSCTIS